MTKNRVRRLMRKTALILAALLLVVVGSAFPLHVHGETFGSGRDVVDKISLNNLMISIDNEVIYDSTRTQPISSVQLQPDSTMSFSLHWDVTGNGDEFQKEDYFSIPVVYVENLRLIEPFTQTLEIDAVNGQTAAVAEGRFTYTSGLLAFHVVFNRNAADYHIEGGPAGGYAKLSLNSGQTELPIAFGDSQTFTMDVDPGPGGRIPLPGLPTYPGTLPVMHKAVFSPDVNGSTISLLTQYPTMQADNEHKFGLDWRMTFFDLVSHFQSGGAATENVIIEEIVGEGLEFANFASFAEGDRDKGFSAINDEDYEAPFFIEIPIVAVGSNRIYNLYGDDTLSASSQNGYISTLIRAGQLQQITGSDVADVVRQRPLSWGIEKLGDGREKLIINLGKLGPDVKKDEGLTADLVKEKDYPYTILDDVLVKELLTAQRMIEANGTDAEQWKRVRKESLDTILYYWPGYKDKLCDIAGISTGSDTAAIKNALFAMTYDQLNQSKITTLGYEERRSGGIAGTMQIDSFVLRYRTVLSSVTDTDISNSVKVTTGILDQEDWAAYHHQFYAGIFGTVRVGEIAFIKVDIADGHRSGETTEEEIRNIRGLADAEFELYKVDGGAPLRFTKNGSVYGLQTDGDVTVLRSDADGMFKITGLSPTEDYALWEKTAPPGYQLPSDRRTMFRVSSSASKYYVITNKEKSTTPDTPSTINTPGTLDTPGTLITTGTPGTSNTPGTTGALYTNVPPSDLPRLGDDNNIPLAMLLMMAAEMIIIILLFKSYRQMQMR